MNKSILITLIGNIMAPLTGRERVGTYPFLFPGSARDVVSQDLGLFQTHPEYSECNDTALNLDRVMAAADGPLPVVALEVDDLTCPLTQELFVSPVSCSCGHTFNKSELRRCLARQELECPLAAPLPRVPTGGERVVTLACGHAYDRDLIKQLIEMKHDKCIVCSGQVMPPTAALLKTTR